MTYAHAVQLDKGAFLPKSRDGRHPDVFVSFATADLVVAKDISESLEAAGIVTFFAPRDIHGGMNFAVEIVKAVASCDAVIVLLSHASQNSPHVRREVALAIDERRVLLPITMPGTRYPEGFTTEWTYWLSAVQVMEYDGPAAIVSRLHGLIPRDRPETGRTISSKEHSQGDTRGTVRRQLRPSRGTPSALLRPDRGMPTLLGRDGELARLQQWCLRDDDFDIRIVTGGAGQGKTRLAYELTRGLETEGWVTHLVAPDASGEDLARRLSRKPSILVFDYAETRSEQLHDLLLGLLNHGVHDKLRLLLLARTAADWWKTLMACDANIADLLADVTVQPLGSLVSDRDVVNGLYLAAYQQFGAELQREPREIVAAPYKSYGSVLEILEDALAALLGDAAEIGPGTDRLLAHERRYLTASARSDGIEGVDDVDLNRIAGALTLYTAASEDEAALIVEECNRDLDSIVRRKLARLFRRLYPGTACYVDGIRPDALAEDLIAGLLDDDGQLPGLSGGLSAGIRTLGQRRHALTMLARGAMRHEAVAAELNRTIRNGTDDLLTLAIEVATQVEEPDRLSSFIADAVSTKRAIDAEVLLDAIPEDTVALADLAAQLARRAIAALPESDTLSNKDVKTAMTCSNRFSDVGWSADAAESAQFAVDTLLSWDSGRRDDCTLGRALNNLSNRLWEMGRLTESVKPAEDAVELLVNAHAPVVEIAAARNNFAFRLAEVDRGAEAAEQALEAERLCRQADIDDINLGKTLGASLNNLTCITLAAGRPREALNYGITCVDLRRTQALQNRDRYLPYVARALANAAASAEASGESKLADRFLIEARSLHVLTGQRAPIFRFEQAESSTLFAAIQLARGNVDAAQKAEMEARDLLGSIAVSLGYLAVRLTATLDRLHEHAASAGILDFVQFVVQRHGEPSLPHLLEYRDL